MLGIEPLRHFHQRQNYLGISSSASQGTTLFFNSLSLTGMKNQSLFFLMETIPLIFALTWPEIPWREKRLPPFTEISSQWRKAANGETSSHWRKQKGFFYPALLVFLTFQGEFADNWSLCPLWYNERSSHKGGNWEKNQPKGPSCVYMGLKHIKCN